MSKFALTTVACKWGCSIRRYAVPHILIADDEFPQRTLIRETLAGDPTYHFTEASNGAEALERIWADPPDVAILDIVMPDMGGLQLCRNIKGEPRSVRRHQFFGTN
jgi:CheY-like chemotaxis protein